MQLPTPFRLTSIFLSLLAVFAALVLPLAAAPGKPETPDAIARQI
jgi:hypothetical protein